MREIWLLRGCPGSGKSTWIKNNNLEPYTIGADNIRNMVQSPVMGPDGKYFISQKNDKKVWEMLFDLVEQRMGRGDFIIVDATHYKSSLLSAYNKYIKEYRYRAFVIDFTDVPVEVALERNAARDEYKFVPEDVIKKMCAVFNTDDSEVSKKFNIIKPDEALKRLNKLEIFDYNKYNKVLIFGDIHGCYEPLKQWFKYNPFDENTAYIFTGDYFDRGIQNKEVFEFLLSIYNNKNVLLLEGNHEAKLRQFASDNEDCLKKLLGRHNSFHKTGEQLSSVNKKDIRQLCRKFGQLAYINFRNKNYLITHGGMSNIPSIATATEQLIRGVGKYEDIEAIQEVFHKNAPDTIQISGHRNVTKQPIKVNDFTYNVCDEIEYGGYLRIVELLDNGSINTHSIKNDIFDQALVDERERRLLIHKAEIGEIEPDNIIDQLECSRLINKKTFDNIVSYNFTREAFYDRKWNQLTCTARGLFIDKDNKQIAARSYNKFFNWGEMLNDTQIKDIMQFPVHIYRKENGFLGMISYNHEKDELMFASKSSLIGDYADYVKQLFDTLVSDSNKQNIKEYLKNNNSTMVFECINFSDNSHPIKYKYEHLYLLDIIENSFAYKKIPYNELVNIAYDFGLENKKLVKTINDWDSLMAFKKQAENDMNPSFEGYVLEDSDGFMIKIKKKFYKYWKSKRGLLESLVKHHNHNVNKNFSNEMDVKVYRLILDFLDNHPDSVPVITDIERMYYQDLKPVDILE